MGKEMDVLSYLSEDRVFKFLVKFKELENEYRKMKKVYDVKIKQRLKEIVGNEGLNIQNDVFKVTISQPQEIEKIVSMAEARKLPSWLQKHIFKSGKTSSRMVVKLLDEETDEDW